MKALYVPLYKFFRGVHRYFHVRFSPKIKRRRAVYVTYRRLRKLAKRQGDAGGTTKILGWEVSYLSAVFLFYTYVEIFINNDYWFTAGTDTPRIIDAGANVGLAMLYFKYLYPDAEVICLEPDPANIRAIKRTVRRNQLKKVDIRQVAVSDRTGTATMYFDPTSPGDTGQSTSKKFRSALEHRKLTSHKVKTQSLRPLLAKPVDLLKLDIEGTEGKVLKDIAPLLSKVDTIHLEYHFISDNALEDILRILRKAGFQYRIHAPKDLYSQEGSAMMIYAGRDLDKLRPLQTG